MKIIILALSIFLLIVITFDLFLKEPPVWPDEASLVQISSIFSVNFQEGFRQYPSFYPPLLSSIFSITGISIEVQRLLSAFAGFAFIVVFLMFVLKTTRDFKFETNLAVLPIALLITDFTFLQSMRVGRPEIFTLLFGLVSIFLLFKYISDSFEKLILLILSFVFAILALLFHPNGFIYLVTEVIITAFVFKDIRKSDQKIIASVTGIISIFAGIIILRILPTLSSIIKRIEVSNAQDSWLFTVFTSKPIELKTIYFSFLIISIIFLLYLNRKKSIQLFTLGLSLTLSWIVLLFNKDFWYAVYIVPFVYLSFLILADNYYKQWHYLKTDIAKYKFIGLIFICLLIFLSNLIFHMNILIQEGGDKYSYEQYIKEIQEFIPDHGTVFTSAIPDPYYAFVNRKNIVNRFPQSYVDRNDYLKELNESEYIIYNGPYGNNYYGTLVMDYLKLNTLETKKVGQAGQYQSLVVKLKPKDQRVNP
ncbi:MAG: hypothetical protein PHQ59_03905 [Candidatus Daviesbacteria bacterium]|nr:hypothetical protein [Candidatus Daviesbacteria bacterium]